MRALRVFEKFKQDSDPISDMGIGAYAYLKKKGVKFYFEWDRTQEEEKKAVENMGKILALIEKLVKAGASYEQIYVSHYDNIYLRDVFEVVDSNHVIFFTITQEDAKILMDVCLKFNIHEYNNYHLEKGEKFLYVNGDHTWLDNLIENRERYKKMVGNVG